MMKNGKEAMERKGKSFPIFTLDNSHNQICLQFAFLELK